MSYCDGMCPHLNEKAHKCNLTGAKLVYLKGWWGTTHEHMGFCRCDEDMEKDKNLKDGGNNTAFSSP